LQDFLKGLELYLKIKLALEIAEVLPIKLASLTGEFFLIDLAGPYKKGKCKFSVVVIGDRFSRFTWTESFTHVTFSP
jgi:hypothetical protein